MAGSESGDTSSLEAIPNSVRERLRQGVVIPAMPLALTAERRLDERRQRALCRYYLAAGAGGLAVGVHTTQFAIRDPKHGLFDPLLALVAEEMDKADEAGSASTVRIAGICGPTGQALGEARSLREHGYHAGLLSLAAFRGRDERTVLEHCRAVSEVIPLVGFYLQNAVGGPDLSYRFWREFLEIGPVVAIKIAPFDRYRTLDVVRAAAESEREDVALYTGNDDNIIMDLLTPYHFPVNGRTVERRIVGGLLGHWAVWTRRAVELLDAVSGCSGQRLPSVGDAPSCRGSHRHQRRVLRRGQPLRGLHSRFARGSAAARLTGRSLVPGPGREVESGAGGGHRPGVPGLSASER